VSLYKKLQRDVRREALTRIEDSARTQAEFENVAHTWDKLDENRERKERYHEVTFTDIAKRQADLDEFTYHSETVIPIPIMHRLWRQLMSGYLIDVIFDCPYEIDELVSSETVSNALKSLNDNQKEIIYFRLIRNWSPQKIAEIRGQTDRNIRRVYDMAIENIRRKLGKGKK